MKRISTLFFSKKVESVGTQKQMESKTSLDKVESTELSLPSRVIADIYFPRISFSNCPFIWYYYRTEDLAIWTGKLLGTPQEEYNSKALLLKLQCIPGVIIKDGDAVITGVSDFCLKHQMNYLPQVHLNTDFIFK